MRAVVALLDQKHADTLRSIRTELSQRFHVKGTATNPYPHFSFHVAASYNMDALDAAMKEFVATHRRIRIRTGALGLFTGTFPVLHVALVRDEPLNTLHRDLVHAVAPAATDAVKHCAPQLWTPHITLARLDLTHPELPAILSWINARHFEWHLTVQSLANIGEGTIWQRWALA